MKKLEVRLQQSPGRFRWVGELAEESHTIYFERTPPIHRAFVL